MQNVEFEIGENAQSGSAAGHRGRRQPPPVPTPLAWTLLAVVLLLAGATLTLQAEPSILGGDEATELHYQYNDGAQTASWRWDSAARPDQDTVAHIGEHLAATTDVPEWVCLFTANAPQSPYPGPGDEPDGSVVCTATICEAENHTARDGSVPRVISTVWIPPVGWEWPVDGAVEAN